MSTHTEPAVAVSANSSSAPDTARTMKAIVHERYGPPDVLELREVELPAITDEQVLVRVHASSVNPVEWYERRRGRSSFAPSGMGCAVPRA